jgi:hypothetical protein
MQTLISVFDDRADARKAVDKLVDAGFARDDVHMHEAPAHEPGAQEIEEEDRGMFDSLGHFFVSLFGEDRGEKAAGAYRDSIRDGHSVVMVDAHDDHEAETAAVILHDQGAVEVDDRESDVGTPTHPGVRSYQRESRPTIADMARQRQLREDSLLADRAGQVSTERAMASDMTPRVDLDRPK